MSKTIDRWKLEMKEGFKLNFTPDIDEMSKFVSTASQELTEKIMEAEEKLVLTAISEQALRRLIMLCKQELTRRRTRSGESGVK